eukprot:NODE_315_length_11202_cov_0.258849.p5 type:complete len:348 gc:universal NODE_315_length_11202_cov_0.258849:3090-2047(-)
MNLVLNKSFCVCNSPYCFMLSLEQVANGEHRRPSKMQFNTRVSEPPTFRRLFMAISCKLANENEWALLHLISCQDYPVGLIPPFIDRLTSLSLRLLESVNNQNPLLAPNTNSLLLYCMVCLNNLAISNGSSLISIPETFELLNRLLDLNTLFKDQLHIKKIAFFIFNSMANSRWLPSDTQIVLFKKLCSYLLHEDRWFIQQTCTILSSMIRTNPHKDLGFVYDEIIKYTERLVQLIIPRHDFYQDVTENTDFPMITSILELVFYSCFHSQALIEALYMHPRDVVSILIYYLGLPVLKVQGIPMYSALSLNAIYKQYHVMDMELIYCNIKVQADPWFVEWYLKLLETS